MDEDTLKLIKKTDRLFLPKPFIPEELNSVIIEVLKQKEK